MQKPKQGRKWIITGLAALLGVVTYAGHSLTATNVEGCVTPVTRLFGDLTHKGKLPNILEIGANTPELFAGPCSGPLAAAAAGAAGAAAEKVVEKAFEKAERGRGGGHRGGKEGYALLTVAATQFDTVPVGGYGK